MLSSQQLIIEIPDYVNGRSTPINAELIKTALWIWLKQIMEPSELREAFLCYETTIKKLGVETIPLGEKILNEALRPIDKVLSSSLFEMWCKKCWQFLACAKTLKDQPPEKRKDLNASTESLDSDEAIPPNMGLRNFSEYEEFSLLPHEFLVVVCNAFRRLSTIKTVYKPDFSLRKKEIITNFT